MKTKSVRVWLLMCACVLAACGGDEPGASEFEPDVELGDAGASDAAVSVVESDAGARSFIATVLTDAAVVDAAAMPSSTSKPDAATANCVVSMHRDADGDGFGEATATLIACGATGFVDNGLDCYDGNADARPRPADFSGTFVHDRGDGSFDYDCDGVETKLDDVVAECPVFTEADSHCPPPSAPYVVGDSHNVMECYEAIRDRADPLTDGWWGQIAACGEVALYSAKVSWSRASSYTCGAPDANSLRWQTCR